MGHAVLLVGAGDVVGFRLGGVGGIGHRHAQSGIFDHGDVVVAVAYGNDLLACQAEGGQEACERGSLVDAEWNTL